MTEPMRHRLMIRIPYDLRGTIQKTANEMGVTMSDFARDLINRLVHWSPE